MRRNGSIRVLIVGAGVGGLALAGALHRAGASVTVVERTAEFGRAGSGLSLFGNGFRALDALGAGDAVRAVTAPHPPRGTSGTRRPDGSWLARIGPSATAELRVADRTELHRALLSRADGAEIRTGAQVTAADDAGAELATGDGLDGFDLVVGADGLRSRVRAGWPDDPGVAYSGYGTWRGITAGPVPLHAGGETLGRGRRFGMVQLRDDRVYWFGVVTAPADALPSPAVLRETFAGWHDPIPALLAGTDEREISYLPIEYLGGRLDTYARGRRVLIGDAAHAMPPDLGQGANQALEDAAVLATLLAPVLVARTPDRIPAALRRYDELRRPRSQRIAARARLMGRVMQAAGAAGAVRDAAIRLTPDTVATRQAARLQAWHPTV